MKETLKNLFFYAGLDRDEYHAVRPQMLAMNRGNLQIYTLVGGAAFLALTVISLLGSGFFNTNVICYAVCTGVMLVLALLLRLAGTGGERLTVVLMYVFEFTLYIFGVVVSLLHADLPAVSAMAFLLVTPLLFYDRPSSVILTTLLVVVPFCVLVLVFKSPEIAVVDIWNMITFGFVGIAVNLFLLRVKLRGLAQERRASILSETDILTSLKNRNCYEQRLSGYPEQCRRGLGCVFMDVNGLHELNNRQGHLAGDRMLQAAAKAFRESFGSEHSYRVGGDEFVAFAPDWTLKELQDASARIGSMLEAQEYHVSCGAVYAEKQDGMDVGVLVQSAEREMFAAKKAYYERPENNRRMR